MAIQANQSQRETNNNFGLPKAEFKPIEPGGSNRWLKITAITVGVVFIIGAGTVYWLFRCSSPTTNNLTTNTLKSDQEIENSVDNELKEPDEKEEDFMENVSSEEVDTEKSAPKEHTDLAEAGTKPGYITKVSAPHGLYYVIVASYIDADLAMDYAKQLAKQGAHIELIEPQKGKHFFRVAIEQGTTFQEASEKAEKLQSSCGVQTWIIKH
ncbi:MAG: SPOR domain-containing protein [Bacteroidota bacterium]